jgi:hypothetical protein
MAMLEARYEAGDPDEEAALGRPVIVAEMDALLTDVERLLAPTEGGDHHAPA